ncbi:hypothetical protein AAZX31_20G054700 [Glycine max]
MGRSKLLEPRTQYLLTDKLEGRSSQMDYLIKRNDCGIWVAKWMLDCKWSSDYHIQDDNKTRMELALDVALDSLQHNER